MPAKSQKQRKLFGLVHAVQKGERSPTQVSRTVRRLAHKMDPKSVKDFAATSEKNLPLKVRMEMLNTLKEFSEPIRLQEGQTNPVAKEFTKTAIYDQYIQKFVGLPFSQKELESINNYTEVKPSKIDKNQIRYESSDQFNNNTTTVVKKLREGSQFAYTAFTKYVQTKPSPDKEQPTQPSQPGAPGQPPAAPTVTPAGPQPEDIIVAKSVAFADDISGSKTLSDFLRKLDL